MSIYEYITCSLGASMYICVFAFGCAVDDVQKRKNARIVGSQQKLLQTPLWCGN